MINTCRISGVCDDIYSYLRGLTIGSTTTIDSLKYQYFSNSNQLQKVSDAAVFNSAGLGDFRDTTLSGDDYIYDVNGNITKDYNRHMHTPANGLSGFL